MMENFCLDCFWCDLVVDFSGKSHYCCRKNGERLIGSILNRPACPEFLPQETMAETASGDWEGQGSG
ncbi:MAG: hypothetical protein HYT79_03360 [Elusimicrobia bacterium]|nr:hypothetical protein [Elusimicrobiota bacterium]